jgi:hypothetical protein
MKFVEPHYREQIKRPEFMIHRCNFFLFCFEWKLHSVCSLSARCFINWQLENRTDFAIFLVLPTYHLIFDFTLTLCLDAQNDFWNLIE